MRHRKASVTVIVLLTMNLLSGCASAPASDYCRVAEQIKPDEPEIDALIHAGLIPLARRIDRVDTLAEDLCPGQFD